MVRLLPLLAMLLAALVSYGQDLSITFSGTGAANKIDSVTATNLATNQSVTLPGSSTLILTPKTGIPDLMENAAQVMIFPNPFSGRTTIYASVQESQQFKVEVRNLVGQVVSQTEAFVQPGDNEFILFVSAEGIYLVSLTTNQGTTGFKVICTGSSGSNDQVLYLGSGSTTPNKDNNDHLDNNHNLHNPQLTTDNRQPTTLKILNSVYTLGYSSGDTIEYRCRSGNFTAIFTDSPLESKNYEVAFAPIANFTIDPTEGNTETKFVLDASSSSDAETPADDLEVRWDLNGDGNWDTDWDIGKYAGYQFQWAGSYSIILEVRDVGGLTGTKIISVNVVNTPEGTFTDPRDRNKYPYKTIGTQVWMTKNMAYLPVVSPSSIGSGTSPYCYVHGYDGSSVPTAKGTSNYAVYGVLYNWTAAKTACPSGWHLPTDEEWKILEKHLGMSESDANFMGERISGTVGGKLKEAGTTHWLSPNTGANNSTGFTALPGGYRNISGGFGGLGEDDDLWSASEVDASNAWDRNLTYTYDGVYRYYDNRGYGFSVRCIRD